MNYSQAQLHLLLAHPFISIRAAKIWTALYFAGTNPYSATRLNFLASLYKKNAKEGKSLMVFKHLYRQLVHYAEMITYSPKNKIRTYILWIEDGVTWEIPWKKENYGNLFRILNIMENFCHRISFKYQYKDCNKNHCINSLIFTTHLYLWSIWKEMVCNQSLDNEC